SEFMATLQADLDKYEDEFYAVGIRFEDKDRAVDEICENSRHNSDREDEREFPEFGTEEYDDMEELDGACAWDIPFFIRDNRGEDNICFYSDHAYIVASNDFGHNDDPDVGEIVIADAKVLVKLF
ncbi:MAG: hypothetical protein ABF820_11775, partial [Sporolactobacillus sp.]